MADDLTLALGSFVISAACAVGSFIYSRKFYEETRVQLLQLSERAGTVSAMGDEVAAGVAQVKGGLEQKITRNAMQSITKQAKDITSAVIGGSG